jgi:hypothetical protein
VKEGDLKEYMNSNLRLKEICKAIRFNLEREDEPIPEDGDSEVS